MNIKKYDAPMAQLMAFNMNDIVTVSGGFDGEDDVLFNADGRFDGDADPLR